MEKKSSILAVDDENGVLQSYKIMFGSDHRLFLADTADKAIKTFFNNSIDLILLDILLPDSNGLELLKKFKEEAPETEIIMVSAVNEIKTAVKAMKKGAFNYVLKPFDVEDITILVKRALEKHSLVRENKYLRNEIERFRQFERIIGKNNKMLAIFDLISTIGQSDGSVLIQGETGSGKELIARAIHSTGNRKEQPFVVINCAAIPETLMESEIFGHKKGAFTGASFSKVGKLEIADKGIVFLDDVDTLDIGMQAKLLRAIQEREFERLGSTKLINIDVRFLAASNRNLKQLIEQGKFREDLYYRLNVFPVDLPPLRERRDDIPLLLDHFLEFYSKKNRIPVKRFSKSALKMLVENYDWPGNIRELQNLVERLTTIVRGNIITPKDITTFEIKNKETKEIKNLPLKDAVDIFEKQYITDALKRTNGSKKEAARILGIHRNTLQKKLSD